MQFGHLARCAKDIFEPLESVVIRSVNLVNCASIVRRTLSPHIEPLEHTDKRRASRRCMLGRAIRRLPFCRELIFDVPRTLRQLANTGNLSSWICWESRTPPEITKPARPRVKAATVITAPQ